MSDLSFVKSVKSGFWRLATFTSKFFQSENVYYIRGEISRTLRENSIKRAGNAFRFRNPEAIEHKALSLVVDHPDT